MKVDLGQDLKDPSIDGMIGRGWNTQETRKEGVVRGVEGKPEGVGSQKPKEQSIEEVGAYDSVICFWGEVT